MEKDKDGKVKSYLDKTTKKRQIVFDDECNFNRILKSIKNYNMKAYKEFVFYYMKTLRAGGNPGKSEDGITYVCDLFSSDKFKFVYGEITFKYTVENDKVTIYTIEPTEVFMTGYQKQLESYKGVPVLGPREKFKIDLYESLKKEEEN